MKTKLRFNADPPQNAFATRLDEALATRGMSLNQLAKAIHIGAGTASKVRSRGALRISPALLFAIADAVGVDARWLFTGEGAPATAGAATAPTIAPDIARLRERIAQLEQALRVVETTSRSVLRRSTP